MKLFFVITVFLICCKSGVCETSGPSVTIQDGTIVRNLDRIDIPLGEPLEIICTGEAEKLQITLGTENVTTTVVNETTIRYFEENPKRGDARYSCIDINDPNSKVVFFVSIGMLPETGNVSCISKNLEYISCTWTSSDIESDFHLFQIKDGKRDSHGSPLCRISVGSPQSTFECTWNIENRVETHDFDNETLFFLMEACNNQGCSNQTFEIHHRAIIKLDPPSSLRILQISSHTVVLQWTVPKPLPLQESELCIDHRISYWHSGIQPVQVNTSSLKESEGNYEIELTLPCAETYYEVNVSIRPADAVKEEYWSDDVVIDFMTDSESEEADDVYDRSCIRKFDTEYVFLDEIMPSKRLFELEQYQLKEKISSLKTKYYCKMNLPLF